MQAHVVCPISSWGDAPYVRFEWNVNGMVYAASDLYNGQASQLEIDVPELSTVRLDAIVVKDGNTYTSSSDPLSVGSAPVQPPATTPPVMPTFGGLSVAYWF